MEGSNNPRDHATRIKTLLEEVSAHARADVAKVDDPRARALFETTAEVLDGLTRGYRHYIDRSEAAWR